MQMKAQEFLKEAGLDEPLFPGQIKYKQHIGEKAGTSYTVVYDWKTNPDKIRVELRAGLSGLALSKKDLSKHAVWLQSETYAELDLTKKTKH